MMKALSAVLTLFLLLFPMAAFTACGAAATVATAGPAATGPSVAAAAAPGSTAVSAAQKRPVRLSTTTSVHDAGLLPGLEKQFEARTGYPLDIIANGTGAAIKLGETGDADVLLVHARASEEAFIAAGFGAKRIPFMHNFFIVAGPENDPAMVRDAASAADAFARIAAAQAPFVSRGDDSGTHKAEQAIWARAGVKPEGGWYRSAGKGMGPCLQMAGEMAAYILTDQATYLATKSQTRLSVLLDESEDMKNTYSLIAVNPERHGAINAAGAQAFIDFMLSSEAQAFIAAFGIDMYGEPLFIHDGAGS